jgi:DNA polymerase II large subunit
MKTIKISQVEASSEIKEYYAKIYEDVEKQLRLAKEARGRGFDLETDVETMPVKDLAERAETLVGPPGIAERYREKIKEAKGDRMQVIFELFKEIIEQKWCKIPDPAKRIEQAIKTALVLETEGVVVAPIDGVPKVTISENLDGTKYVDVYYAGPIRAAGGTAAVLPLILGDYARKLMGLDRYKPTKDEVERYVEEVQIYDEIVSRQYRLSDDEVRKIVLNCPVCINGEPTEEREVSVHRDLKRIPHNRVRGGMCLVLSEGVALKAMKIMKFAQMLKLDWSWLEDIIKVKKVGEQRVKVKPNTAYLEGTAAGRPIFAYPSRIGGFRLRYGRSRTTGIMAKAIHPATMYVLDEFIATGTQMKIERPGKAAGMAVCDSIEGPIVKLKNGEVLQLKSSKQAKQHKESIETILFLGDLLVSYGDFRYSAHPLIPAGYCEEWWAKELEAKLGEDARSYQAAVANPWAVGPERALAVSERFNVPLHPKYLRYYSLLTVDEAKELSLALIKGKKDVSGTPEAWTVKVKENSKLKELMEKIGLEHTPREGDLIVKGEIVKPLLRTFTGKNDGKGNEQEIIKVANKSRSVLEMLTKISGLIIRDKAGSFIGARMGRPEASTPRKMRGNPHVLFPVGEYGGNTRSILKAINAQHSSTVGISIEVALFKCPKCGDIHYGPYCNRCNVRTVKILVCPKCNIQMTENLKRCPKCGSEELRRFNKRKIALDKLFSEACKRVGRYGQEEVKGVRGLMNQDKLAEPLEKGILRAKHDVHIFRDGTIRYELINNPLTHFKPKEIGTSVGKLRELGYTKDIEGRELVDDEQLVELKPQDIIIHKEAGDFLVRVSKFIDDELESFYGLKRYYNAETREDLVGRLVLGLAPHTSAAVVGRIIGYTDIRACLAHPYFHQTKRRNCDGDQDSIMLLMDALLNFSHHYLPAGRGGRMDAPLVFTVMLNPAEIDNEVFEMEVCSSYPLELYEKALKYAMPEDVDVEIVSKRLGQENQYCNFGFTHNTSSILDCPTYSKYVQLTTMSDKIRAQVELQSKIVAVDKKDSIERVMVSHFLPDIIGNVRAFGRQQFRCTNCNTKYRRLPLSGRCTNCGKTTLVLTVAEGSVRKYLEIAKEIVEEYDLSNYIKQRVKLVEQEVNSLFKTQAYNQKSLAEFA